MPIGYAIYAHDLGLPGGFIRTGGEKQKNNNFIISIFNYVSTYVVQYVSDLSISRIELFNSLQTV